MHRRRPVLALAATTFLLLGVAACGADSGDEPGGGAGGDTKATSTTAAGGGSDDPTTTTGGDQKGGDELTDAQLQAMLLTLDDLPDGFVKSTDDDDAGDDADDAEDETDDFQAADPACQSALDAFEDHGKDDDEPEASVSFDRNDANTVEHEIDVTSRAADMFEMVKTTLRDDCGGEIELAGEDVTSGAMKIVDGKAVGDESIYLHLAFKAENEGMSLEAGGYFAMVRNGDVVSTVIAFSFSVPAFGLEGDVPELADINALTEAAQQRYEDAVG